MVRERWRERKRDERASDGERRERWRVREERDGM